MSEDQIEVNIHESTAKVGKVRLAIRFVIAMAVLGLGVFVMKALIAAKPEAKVEDTKETAPLVEVTTITTGNQQVAVTASGTVIPARQVVIAAEVGGRVTWMSKELVPGGRFAAGKPVLKVDARDYQLAVEQQNAQVTLARTALEVEKGRRRVAEKEWEAFGEKAPEGSLATRDPQIKAAEGQVKAAGSGLRRAKLAVSKTGLSAPFDAMVLERQVDLGQLVGPGTPLATLVGTDQFWVQVSVPVERLSWIAIPGVGGVVEGGGSKVSVEQRLGDQKVKRSGRVVRLAGDVDPIGRMARVLVEIDDPLGLTSKVPGTMPLLLNSYVDVIIDGPQVDGVSELPRIALHGDAAAWVLEDQTLRFRPVEVVWRKHDTVLVRGLANGAQVVTSPVPAAVDGMAVRTLGSASKPHAKGTAADAGVRTP